MMWVDHFATRDDRVDGPRITRISMTIAGWTLTGKPTPWSTAILHLVNDPLRTDGWQPGFSESPCDGVLFDYAVQSIEDVNHLIALFTEIDDPDARIVLELGTQPSANRLMAKERPPVVFSLGNQGIRTFWYRHAIRSKAKDFYGPKATPPTLTLYVEHRAIDLERLHFPPGINLSVGRSVEAKAEQPTAKKIRDLIDTQADKSHNHP
jgi:hypothetical protein